MAKLSHHESLIHIMVTMAAVDRSMGDSEMAKMGDIIKSMPLFTDYNSDNLVTDMQICSGILQEDNGLAQIIDNARDSLPPHLHETAYAVAVEVAAADLKLEQTELRLLQMLRDELDLDKLACAAIERGAKARYRRL